MTSRNLSEEMTLTNNGFLFDHVTGLTYTLNSTGGFILKKIIDGNKPNEIIAELTQSFDVNDSTARNDFEEFFELARVYGIL
ncbi:MAG: PqqD family protein [Ignavibacteria bacterium]|nr:PqqD family protein [Ignavibacteria bacterium]